MDDILTIVLAIIFIMLVGVGGIAVCAGLFKNTVTDRVFKIVGTIACGLIVFAGDRVVYNDFGQLIAETVIKSIYTEENPYVTENYYPEVNQHTFEIDYYPSYPEFAAPNYTSLEEKIEQMEEGYMALIVRKTSSKSYAWCSVKGSQRATGYTDSTIEVQRKIAGSGEKYEALNIGDELSIIEAYSILFGDSVSVFDDEYKFNRNGLEHEEIYDNLFSKYREQPPLLKFDTDYLVILFLDYQEGDEFYCGSSLVESEKLVGKYIKFYAYQFNAESASTANRIIENSRYNPKNMEKYYYKMITEAWDLYREK